MMLRSVCTAITVLTFAPMIYGGVSTDHDWIQEGGTAFAKFGSSVQTAGDVNGDGFSDFLVGSPGFSLTAASNEGRAFLFLGGPDGADLNPAWITQGETAGEMRGTVAAAGDVNGDGFGDVIVGAPGWNGDAGRVMVFHGSPLGLSLTEDWFLEGVNSGDVLGQAISTAGDVNGDGFSDILIGRPFDTDTLSSQGRVQLYLGSLSGLATVAVFEATGAETNEQFGHSVALAGDVDGDGLSDFLVGSRLVDSSFAGRASLYLGSATPASMTTNWTPTGNPNDELGASLSTAGDVNGDGFADVAVALPGIDTVNIYHGKVVGPALTPDLTLSVAAVNFAQQVAPAGDLNGDGYGDLLVGTQNSGRAFAYQGGPTGLETTPLWSRVDAEPSFGEAVATAGDVNGDGFSDLLIGSPLFDNGQVDEGNAKVFNGGSALFKLTPEMTFLGSQVNERFGARITAAGDVNADGRTDWLMGSPNFENGETGEGRILFFYGGPAGPNSLAPDVELEGNEQDAAFGKSVAAAGDVNGDGFDDILVGSPGSSIGAPNAGAARVFLGPLTSSSQPAWTIAGDASAGGVGKTVEGARDVNGDGFDDVLVRRGTVDPQVDAVELYFGSKNGLAENPAWSMEGVVGVGFPGLFGISLAGLGDVNGDGFDDIGISEPGFDGSFMDEGRVVVYLGSPTGPSLSPDWTFLGGGASALLGLVARAGDVDGDGFDDLLAAAPALGGGGTAWLFRGAAAGLEVVPVWTDMRTQANALFGLVMVGGCDANGDGFSDVVISSVMATDTLADEGIADFYLGGPDGLGSPVWTKAGGVASGRFGCGMAFGDGDGDGYADLAIGAQFQDGGPGANSGVVHYFPGNGAAGRGLVPRQGTNAKPVAAGNGSNDDEIHVRVLARGPFGRTMARVQVETRPYGVPFGGPAIDPATFTSGPLADTGLGGLETLITTEDWPEGSFHWRTRLLNDPVTTPWMPASRFVSLPCVGANSRHIRLLEKQVIFVPGDTLLANFDEGPGQALDAVFDALDGSKLKLKFPQTNVDMVNLVLVIDPSGEVVKSATVDHSGNKTNKTKVKLRTTGTYLLRLIRISGTSQFEVETKMKLPNAAKPFTKKKVKPDPTTGVALVEVLALPGATLDALFTPKNNFTGPMSLIFRTPSGNTLDLTGGGFQQDLPDGGIQLTGVPLNQLGAYETEIQGFAANNEKVKVTMTPTQPDEGSSTIILD